MCPHGCKMMWEKSVAATVFPFTTFIPSWTTFHFLICSYTGQSCPRQEINCPYEGFRQQSTWDVRQTSARRLPSKHMHALVGLERLAHAGQHLALYTTAGPRLSSGGAAALKIPFLFDMISKVCSSSDTSGFYTSWTNRISEENLFLLAESYLL